MKLQTQISLQTQNQNQIDYNAKILLLGSCFSENIGDKFKYFKFKNAINPFGILFHPLAIENLITRAINLDYYVESELHYYNEQWCCLDAHSKLNANSKDVLLETINNVLNETHKTLKENSHIIITLGTSWAYRHLATDKIVANCHKIPQKEFLKELLSIETITESLEAIICLVENINPNVEFIFTVSPVRHIKDGFVENTQSKSHLIAAIHQLLSLRAPARMTKSGRQSRSLHYFPSYEIMIDELRGYRFYASDMIHPNETAIDYLWEKFASVWLSNASINTLKTISSIQKRKAHRPFNVNSDAYQQFLNELQSDTEALKRIHPHIMF